ncbi:MAG: helix-turn-helix transcriptional regulator [Clostridia bacterium]|nr:AraC family transcriptional regulator [Oscillospiraceae bacterium]MBR6748154.1 helix-turn-helix transcriptional regulator [Clostridia bacterium]
MERRARFHFDNIYGDVLRMVGPYRLWQVGDLYCEPGYTVPPHNQAVHELTYVVSGAGKVFSGGVLWDAGPSDLFFSRPGEPHAIYADAAQPLRYFYLGFSFAEPLQDAVKPIRTQLDSLENACVRDAGILAEAFIRLFGEITPGDAFTDVLLESAMQEVIATACRLFARSESRGYRGAERRDVDEKLVYDLTHYLDAHATDIGVLSALPEVFGYSYTHLAQKFSAAMGESLSRYHNRRRFERAQEYLRRGESITRVAELVGYQSIHAFSRAFHRSVGVTPQEYRQRFNP